MTRFETTQRSVKRADTPRPRLDTKENSQKQTRGAVMKKSDKITKKSLKRSERINRQLRQSAVRTKCELINAILNLLGFPFQSTGNPFTRCYKYKLFPYLASLIRNLDIIPQVGSPISGFQIPDNDPRRKLESDTLNHLMNMQTKKWPSIPCCESHIFYRK